MLPFRTIQRAADAVNPGDTVIVQDGVYTDEDGDGVVVNLTRGGTASAKILFKSQTQWGAKLDGRNNVSETGFRFQSAANYIRTEGFEVYGFGNGGSGGASAFEMYSGGHDTEVVSNNIHDIGRMCTDTTNGEVGVFVQQPRVLIEGNLIHDIGRFAPGENGCSPTGTHYQNGDHGIYVDGSVESATITGANSTTIKNNIFYNNKRGWSIQIYPGSLSGINVFNNTFYGANPYKDGQIVIYAVTLSNCNIQNNIFYQPRNYAITIGGSPSISNTVISYNMTDVAHITDTTPAGLTVTNNSVSTNPLLVNAAAFDFHLSLGSSALDIGLSIPSVTRDFAGVARPQGAGHDLGAYELPH